MPHHDDFDDGPPDLHDFLTELARKSSQPGGAQASGPAVPPLTPPPPRRWLARIVRVLVGAVVAVLLTILGLRNGVHLPGSSARPQSIGEFPTKQEVVYAQREVLVHEDAGRASAVLDTLDPGEPVRAGERASNGWARIFDSKGHALGYAYRSSENFGPRPPTDRAVPSANAEDRRAPEPGTDRPATALCNDGSYWYHPTRSGSCSGHHGVKKWLVP